MKWMISTLLDGFQLLVNYLYKNGGEWGEWFQVLVNDLCKNASEWNQCEWLCQWMKWMILALSECSRMSALREGFLRDDCD